MDTGFGAGPAQLSTVNDGTGLTRREAALTFPAELILIDYLLLLRRRVAQLVRALP